MKLEQIITLLEESQWWTREQIEDRQQAALARLVAHHSEHTESFKQRLTEQGLTSQDVSTLDGLSKLKPITKRDIQQAGDSFNSEAVPPSHLPIRKSQTSGRTGQPVTILKTEMNHQFFCALMFREHSWWQHDYRHRLASVRAVHRQYEESPNWGGPVAEQFETGPAIGIPLNLDVRQQLAYLNEFDPDMLSIHAGVLAAMCSIWESEGYTLNLKAIKNVGETLHPNLRERVKRITGVDISDIYSSSEVGLISIECPGTGLQHIMEETLLVEVLNEVGEQCKPGELGRVVITDFYNTISPMIRYDIGDYAEVGEPCSCGRNHRTLKQIAGRERGLFRRANGDRFWPTAGQYAAEKVVKVNQWQIIQHSLEDIEYKLVTDHPLTKEQHSKLLEIFRKKLGVDCVRITEYRTQLPTDGKYEESICLIE
jgi:phenylacetate-CoA ligase